MEPTNNDPKAEASDDVHDERSDRDEQPGGPLDRSCEAEAAERWPLQASLVVHRIGELAPGENIVLGSYSLASVLALTMAGTAGDTHAQLASLLHVENVDMLDETPLLDIKPYVPEFDEQEGASGGWLEQVRGAVRKTTSDGRFA